MSQFKLCIFVKLSKHEQNLLRFSKVWIFWIRKYLYYIVIRWYFLLLNNCFRCNIWPDILLRLDSLKEISYFLHFILAICCSRILDLQRFVCAELSNHKIFDVLESLQLHFIDQFTKNVLLTPDKNYTIIHYLITDLKTLKVLNSFANCILWMKFPLNIDEKGLKIWTIFI